MADGLGSPTAPVFPKANVSLGLNERYATGTHIPVYPQHQTFVRGGGTSESGHEATLTHFPRERPDVG